MNKNTALALAMSAAGEIFANNKRGDIARNDQLTDQIDNLVGKWSIRAGVKPRMIWPAVVATCAGVSNRRPV